MRSTFRKIKSRAVLGLMALALLICLVPLASLLFTLIVKGSHAISFRFLIKSWAPVGEQGGIAHAIAGSLALLLLASLVAVPLGLATGIYLAQRNSTRLASITRLL